MSSKKVRRGSAPADFVSDLEGGMKAVLETNFPFSDLRQSYFHFIQSINTKLQVLGLSCLYHENSDMRKFILLLMSITFSPVGKVRHNMN